MPQDSTPKNLLDAFQPQDERLRQDLAMLHQSWVRDIAWLLHAPDMAAVGYPGRPTLAELGLDQDEQRRAWLSQLEHRESDFYRHRRQQRLGIYHETLWHWILDHAPHTRLLAHNVPLRENRQTLGELDLLYASRGGGDVETRLDEAVIDNVATASVAVDETPVFHAELAIKFFLGLPEGPGDERDPSRWIGVGSFDSLAIKCHRLQSHQLPKGRSPTADLKRQALGVGGPLQQRIIMPGCLYQPWNQRLRLPRLANENAQRGLWCHRHSWPALTQQLPDGTRGYLLSKPQWLAPPREGPMSLVTLNDELARHFSEFGKSAHLLLVLPDGRQCRTFVVRNEWPPALPLPPRNVSPNAH